MNSSQIGVVREEYDTLKFEWVMCVYACVIVQACRTDLYTFLPPVSQMIVRECIAFKRKINFQSPITVVFKYLIFAKIRLRICAQHYIILE